jgi:transposase-like protein
MDTSTQATELITVKGQSGTRPKRQYRPIEEKRRIVEETLVEGASVARVALSHGVNANQVFGWRKLYLAGATGQREPCDQAVAGPRKREFAIASANNSS